MPMFPRGGLAPGVLQDPVDQGRRRRFAVRPGDSDDPAPEEPVGELDLGQDRDAVRPGGGVFRQERNAGAGHDEVGFEEGGPPVAAGLDPGPAGRQVGGRSPERLGRLASR